MLKRFMNWLLNKLQTLFGAASGKRKPNEMTRPPESIKPVDRLIKSRATESLQSLRRNEASSSKQAPLEPLSSQTNNLSSATPKATPASASLSPFSGLSATPATTQSLSSQPLIQDSNADSTVSDRANELHLDTHKRLDATSSSLDSLKEVKPTFPKEVSELLTPSLPNDLEALSDIKSDPAVRSLKKVSDEQLPAIHDLLPAVEPADTDSISTQLNVAGMNVTEGGFNLSSSTSLGDLDIENSLLEDDKLSPPPEELSAGSEQAVLFSFDIVESESPSVVGETVAPDDYSESVSETFNDGDQPFSDPQLVDSSLSEPIESENISARDGHDESVDLTALEEALPEEDQPISAAVGVEKGAGSIGHTSSEPPTIESSDVPMDSSSEAALVDAARLPYPWSLNDDSTDELAAKPLLEDPSPTVDGAVSKQSVKPIDSETPVKEGIVKLLFMLKKGNFHGYIAPDDSTKDILFHEKYINKEVFGQLERGARVTASVKYVEGKVYATNVNLL